MSIEKALQAVQDSDDGLYGVLFDNGSMELGYYKPTGIDFPMTRVACEDFGP